MNNIRDDFPIFKNNDIAYLDSGATSQKPQIVIDSIKKFYEYDNANIHRGAYELSIRSTMLYNEARDTVAKFINAANLNEIVFTRNASESINLVAKTFGKDNLNENDKVIVSIMEHHSNIVPWQIATKKANAKLEYLYLNNNYEIDEKEIDSKIVPGVKIVAITQVSNVLGTINPVKEIIKKAHKVGAKVLVDASQSAPHFKIDVRDLDADFLVFSGHKMLAPLGIGVLYAKKELLNNMKPFLTGGDMIEYVYEQDATYAEVPTKFEAGTQNVEGAIGLKAAIDYINEIGFEKIEEIEKELSEYMDIKLRELDFVEVYSPKELEKHIGVFSFNIKGIHPHDVASVLDTKGVCVRSGNHCAQPLMTYLEIDSTCRASLYLYNTKEDIDRFIEALKDTRKMFEKWL